MFFLIFRRKRIYFGAPVPEFLADFLFNLLCILKVRLLFVWGGTRLALAMFISRAPELTGRAELLCNCSRKKKKKTIVRIKKYL